MEKVMSTDYIDGVRAKDALEAPSAIPLLVPHTTNVERFEQQMETFARMREINAEARARHDTSAYPRGVIDLRRLTGRNLPVSEPWRNWK